MGLAADWSSVMGSAAIEVGQNEFVTVQQERYELVSNFQF